MLASVWDRGHGVCIMGMMRCGLVARGMWNLPCGHVNDVMVYSDNITAYVSLFFV